MFLSDTVQRERGQRQSIESKIDIVLCLVVLPKEDQIDKDVIVSNVKPPYTLGFPYGSPIHPQCRRCRRNELNPWVGKIPWRRQWQLTPIFLAGRIPWTKEPSGLQPMGLQSQTGLSRHACTISRQQRGQRNMLKCSCIWNQQDRESKVPGSSTEQ